MLLNLEIGDNSLWRLTRKLSRKLSKISPFELNGVSITDDEQKTNILANNFEQQFTANQDKVTDFHTETNIFVKKYIKRQKKNFYNNRQAPLTNKNRIKDIIKNLQDRKAAGQHGISNKALKHLPDNVIAELTRTFNSCIRNVCCPTLWKKSIIKPIPKARNDLRNPKNYIPISLLPTLSKILERIFEAHLQ